MAGLSAAFRLSEPGWRDEFESITVYQRGWRLGGKGASSRGRHGRIEEHGLHIWLGYYENAFRLLRQCYAELDRPRTDPDAPISTWEDAFFPAGILGLEDRDGSRWQHWLGRFTPDHRLPGDPEATGRELTVVEFVQRALTLISDFLQSLITTGEPGGPRLRALALGAVALSVAGVYEAIRLVRPVPGPGDDSATVAALDAVLDTLRAPLGATVTGDPDLRRTWHLVSVMTAVVRGIVADGLLVDPRGFDAANDEDFVAWIERHGAASEVVEFAFVRGLYDLVFGYESGDLERPRFPAGLAVFLTGKMLFDSRGSVFWKMSAGMGDVVFAPLYQVLERRGVGFEFFHRVDHLHLSADRTVVDAVTVGRQVALADPSQRYRPLVEVKGLPCFPAAPLVDQLAGDPAVADQPLESHWCTWPDTETRLLRRGEDFDVIVFAIPVGMAAQVCGELVDDSRPWRSMVEGVSTVATQALQLWIGPAEADLGWRHAGSTVSAYAAPFSTWSSMPQLIDAEDWPSSRRPGTVAYFCGVLDDRGASTAPSGDPTPALMDRARQGASRYVEDQLQHLLPGIDIAAVSRTVSCETDVEAEAVLPAAYLRVNVDPSDRYVQAVPGTDGLRLRPDESGYDNLFLAGDWTDCGLNAGCIEAAVLSGLQAANAVRGRPRHHRIAGYFLP